jgi:hypothetical protein
MKSWLFVLIAIALLIAPAFAVPSTPSISGISSSGFNMSSSTGQSVGWFRWGLNSAYPEWRSPNQTGGGAYLYSQVGSPYWGGLTYYVMACDVTGCSADATFTSISPTPMPQTTFGNVVTNATQTNFNVIYIVTNLAQPLLWALPASYSTNGAGVTLIFGAFIAGALVSLFIRQRKVAIPVFLLLIIIGVTASTTSGLYWGLPAQLLEILEMLTYAGLAGLIMSIFKKG